MSGNNIGLDSFVVHCVPEKWYPAEFWTKWSQWSAILWHCLQDECVFCPFIVFYELFTESSFA